MENKIMVQTMGETRIIDYSIIISLHANGKKTKIKLENGEFVETEKLLGRFEKEFPEYFFRIHDSTIVNMYEIDSIIEKKPLLVITKDTNTHQLAIRRKRGLIDRLGNLSRKN